MTKGRDLVMDAVRAGQLEAANPSYEKFIMTQAAEYLDANKEGKMILKSAIEENYLDRFERGVIAHLTGIKIEVPTVDGFNPLYSLNGFNPYWHLTDVQIPVYEEARGIGFELSKMAFEKAIDSALKQKEIEETAIKSATEYVSNLKEQHPFGSDERFEKSVKEYLNPRGGSDEDKNFWRNVTKEAMLAEYTVEFDKAARISLNLGLLDELPARVKEAGQKIAEDKFEAFLNKELEKRGAKEVNSDKKQIEGMPSKGGFEEKELTRRSKQAHQERGKG